MASQLNEEEMLQKAIELREKFLEAQKVAIESGSYDERDIERVHTNDAYMKCFIRSFYDKDEFKKPLEMIDTVLTFRKKISLNDLTIESFPKDFEDRKVIYWHGLDNENRKILLVKVARHKKGVQTEEMKQYVAWYLEQHHKANLGVRIVLIFDFTDAGITNMDLDLVRFIITCLATYFPSILAYLLLFEMPWLLSSIWKVIRSWLTEEQKNKTILVKKEEMLKYIPSEQLEEHMVPAPQ